MYKLLVLDIDDTLTFSPYDVPEENLAAIRRAQAAGVYVTVATGRGYFGSRAICEAVGMRGPVINYGGAVINDTRTGEAIFRTALAPELVQELLRLGRELGVHAHIYQGDAIVYAASNPFVDAYHGFLNLPHTVDPDVAEKRWENVPKVLFIADDARAEALIPELAARYAGRAKVSGSKAGFIEFNDPSAHKGSAVAWLAAHMGLARDEVAAAGDNLLDIEMIEWAGLGAAVQNGHPAVRAAADMVIPSCGECGVAWLIDHVILGGKACGEGGMG